MSTNNDESQKTIKPKVQLKTLPVARTMSGGYEQSISQDRNTTTTNTSDTVKQIKLSDTAAVYIPKSMRTTTDGVPKENKENVNLSATTTSNTTTTTTLGGTSTNYPSKPIMGMYQPPGTYPIHPGSMITTTYLSNNPNIYMTPHPQMIPPPYGTVFSPSPNTKPGGQQFFYAPTMPQYPTQGGYPQPPLVKPPLQPTLSIQTNPNNPSTSLTNKSVFNKEAKPYFPKGYPKPEKSDQTTSESEPTSEQTDTRIIPEPEVQPEHKVVEKTQVIETTNTPEPTNNEKQQLDNTKKVEKAASKLKDIFDSKSEKPAATVKPLAQPTTKPPTVTVPSTKSKKDDYQKAFDEKAKKIKKRRIYCTPANSSSKETN